MADLAIPLRENPETFDRFIEKWQSIVDISAKLIDVPSALIMRVHADTIEVFASSRTEETPYEKGASEHLDSGLYCETVINERRKLHVPNALEDPEWENNPDVELGMISYLGLPVFWPNDEPFGTICVLDKRTNHYSDLHLELLTQFRDVLEDDLKSMRKLAELEKAVEMIGDLQRILPICSSCKRIRDGEGYWSSVESYLTTHANLLFTHSLCDECAKKFFDQD